MGLFAKVVYDIPSAAKEDRSQSLRNEIQELREEAAALADRTKQTARHAEVLAARIKYLESKLLKNPSKTTR
jgi:septal ring factor EnvC (AmiA/AmiB activator)